MPRGLSSAMIAALSAPVLMPAIFVAATFGTIVSGLVVPNEVFFWSGIGSMTWNGNTYSGLGQLLNVSTVEEGSTVEAKGIVLTLSGLDPTLLPLALNDVILGLPITVYLGLYNSSGTIIATPVTSWSGRMDQPEFSVSPTEVTLTIACEQRLIDLNIPVDRRYTLEDQQMDWPGDIGFQFVDGLQEKTLFFGQFPVTSANV